MPEDFGVWQRVAAKFAYMLAKSADPSMTEPEIEHQGAVLLRHALDIEMAADNDEIAPAVARSDGVASATSSVASATGQEP